MKKKGDHRSRNSAQYERVVELLIMHKGKTDTETNFVVTIGFMTKVDHRTTSKIWYIFTANPVFYRFRGEERKRRIKLWVCDESGEMPCVCMCLCVCMPRRKREEAEKQATEREKENRKNEKEKEK